MIPLIVMMQPWFAVAGLAAVGIAVWMHLYQRTAGKKVKISSLRLVPETPRVARSRKKIQHWPLFLLRALGVILLGLAFARPGLPQSEGGGGLGRETVTFILDRSGSMTMGNGEGETAWQLAVAQLEERLDEMNPQSRVRLFCFPEVTIAGEWMSPGDLLDIVDELEPTLAEGRPLTAVKEASEALARFRSDMPETLEIIGDLQKSGWEELDTLTLPEELRIKVRGTGDTTKGNQGLSLLIRGRDQTRRGAIVALGGTGPLAIDDQSLADDNVTTQEILLPEEVMELPYRSPTLGWVKREVDLADANDGLESDDQLFDTFYVAPTVPVYLLEPEPELETFLQTTFFLKQALRPTEGEGGQDSRYDPRIVPLSEAVTTLQGIEAREVIIAIPALAEWPAELPGIVRDIVRRGGGAVFFAGPDFDSENYQSAWPDLLPKLSPDVSPLDKRLSLPIIKVSHLIWGELGEGQRRSLRRVPLKYRLALSPDDSVNSKILARYIDDIPLVTATTTGEGRALFFNSSMDRSWGDWPADGPLFVPTMHMLMATAMKSEAQDLRNSQGAGVVGESFDVRVPLDYANASLRIADQTMQADQDGWVRNLRLDQPGLYDLTTEGGKVARPIGINFPPQESLREFIPPVILQRQLEARRRTSEAGAARINLIGDSGWWRWILALVILVWLIEPWLALKSRLKTPTPDSVS